MSWFVVSSHPILDHAPHNCQDTESDEGDGGKMVFCGGFRKHYSTEDDPDRGGHCHAALSEPLHHEGDGKDNDVEEGAEVVTVRAFYCFLRGTPIYSFGRFTHLLVAAEGRDEGCEGSGVESGDGAGGFGSIANMCDSDVICLRYGVTTVHVGGF
jgi:hypothetical protein